VTRWADALPQLTRVLDLDPPRWQATTWPS
jgi:hypothetical protein